MDHFSYKDGVMFAEDVAVPEIAATVGTPFYCYSSATLRRHYGVFSEAFAEIPARICFAVKANSNLAVLKTLGDLGAGADTVSEGEIRRALAAGISAEKIVFSGVGKTRMEMHYALDQDIGQFNVESLEELEMLSEVGVEIGKTARVAVRVNPDIDAKTHDKISTGRKHDKFGVAWEQAEGVYARAQELEHIDVIGVATHIGSQLTDLEPFRAAFERIGALVEHLRELGHTIKTLDLGGGLGIPYGEQHPPSPADYADMIIDTVRHLGCELVLEPGRLIAGNAGVLVTSVVLVKNTPEQKFIVVDAGMNDLARPSLYEAYHRIVPVQKPASDVEMENVDVVGPVCESADIFGRDRELPPLHEGDLLAIRSAGAYGAVMSSTYNSRLLVSEVMVNESEFAEVRSRQDYNKLLGQDKLPEWLS